MTDILTSLSSNPYFSAGFGLVGVTSIIALLRKGSVSASKHLYRYYTTTIEVNKNDKSYEWLLEWLSSHQGLKTTHKSVLTNFYQTENGNVLTKYIFPPSVGNHFFRYKNRYIFLERSRSSNITPDSKYGASPFETITFMTLGRGTQIFEEILTLARDHSINMNVGKTLTYIPDSVSWRPFGHPRLQRSIDSVILDEGISEGITDDIREFIASSQWYHERGVPHRRGYLLYGPPGCGKSSLISAVAGNLGFNLCVINLGEPGLTDDRFNYLLNTAPLQSIIVLEDIDAAASLETNYTTNYRLTYSGLLNALDGVASSEQRIIFLTTNHIEKLDKALIRPGRIDVIQQIGYATQVQIERMFAKFYKDSDETSAKLFASNVLKLGLLLSPAQIQSYLLKYKHNPYQACENTVELNNIQ